MAFRNPRGSRSITVEKEGYLYVKKNGSILKPKEKSWQQKYIVLRKSFGDGTFLEWYENFEAFIAHKNSTKLKLDGIDYIGPVDMGKEYTYAFILFGEGQSKLQMAAKNETERSEWIKALNQCLQNGRKSNPTSPTMQRSSSKTGTGYPVKLKDYQCTGSQDILQDTDRDYVLVVGPRCIALIKVDSQGEEKLVLSWLLENIKSYESRPLEQNPTHKLLSIDTGRRSSTGQGLFNFFTPHGDQIKNQISLNTKRTYLEKMNSQDSSDNLYSSSPERSFSTPSRSFSVMSSSQRSTVSSKEGPIPFHKYDPPTNRDSYAPYIQQPNGYVDIFTDQRWVEESRMRHRSRSSVSTSKSPNLDDHPTYVDLPPETQVDYIQVLANGSDSASQYIDVLPEDSPDPSDHAYVDIIGEDETRHHDIEMLDDEKSHDKGFTVPDDHPTYIEVIEDDEPTNQSRNRVISRADSDEIYIDVDENRKRYESREQRFESREQRFESREQHFESREKDLETHKSHTSVHREVHVTHNSLSTRVSTASVSSPSPRWPHSVTSQTSTEFGSLSSENDVFQEREINMVPEVFVEVSEKPEDIPTKSDIAPTIAEVAASNSDALPTNSNNDWSKPEDNSLKCKDYLTKPPLTPRKPTLMASKSASLPTKSEGLATNSDVNSKDLNESRNDGSPKPADSRSTKARSWHSENENDATYNSGNSTSTSESEHAQDSHEFSEDEEHGEVAQFKSKMDHLVPEGRDRSHTAGELQGLKANGKAIDTTMLQAFEMSLTNPQQFTPCPNRHPPLTRETPYTQDQIIAQLENPILVMSKLPDTKKSAVKFKYICLDCGWYKKSKKRPSLKSAFRTKQCPICSNPVTRQSAKSSKNKDKSSGGILNKIIKKRRSSDEKTDKRDPDFMKPERPKTTAEPPFFKGLRDPTINLSRHSPMDPKRSERGLAPSPLIALSAVSIDGGEPRGSVSCDDGTPGGKSSAVGTLTDGVDNGLASPHKTVFPTPSLNRTLAPTPPGSYPLGRTKSSPPLFGGGDAGSAQETLAVEVPECEKVTRKNSALTLPTLPEVEDPGDPTHQTCLTPGTPPPMIPPRTRAPPVPPRRGSSPLATTTREDNTHKLRRIQTDPTFSLPPSSPQHKPKNRVSRTMTDPGQDSSSSNNNIRNAVSLGNLLEDGNEGLLATKVVSLSLGDDIDAETPPPPLPPRRGSGQAAAQPPLPRRVSNDNERLVNSSDSPRIEPRSSAEARRPLPERTPLPGSVSAKLPLSSKRSLDARRDFQARKPLYSSHVGE